MSNVNPIVTYREVNRAFNLGKRGNEAVMKAAQGEAEAAMGDPVEAAMVLASLGNAMKIMEEREVHPGVMIAPDDGVASLLQSFLAQRARDTNQLEPLPTGGEEAKFDEDDLLGWMPLLMAVLKKKEPHKWQQAPAEPEDFPKKSNSIRLAL
ncbi:MAG TPA: hypothetical protein VK619_15960, partial [Pyrinomonadaceae bacterium]|nr:hypothetical protein [Pyrinomonadaceae bacterium]